MYTLTERDNRRELTVRPGDEAEIVLFENASTGFRWTAGTTAGIGIVEDRFLEGSPATGSGGHRRWLIRIAGTGRLEFSAVCRRPFGKETGKKTFNVTFLVR